MPLMCQCPKCGCEKDTTELFPSCATCRNTCHALDRPLLTGAMITMPRNTPRNVGNE